MASPLTIYPSSTDGFLASSHATWLTCRAGSNLSADTTTGAPTTNVGVKWTGFNAYETFLDFDTSSIPDDATITKATFKALVYNGTGDFSPKIVEVRQLDWGGSLSTGDWVAGADLSALTLLASISTFSGLTSFTSEAAFLSAINKTGMTSVIISTDALRSTSDPTAGDAKYASFCFSEHGTAGQKMQLVVEYTEAVDGDLFLDGIWG